MKILFPTPVTWDGNVARYFQRDGGRLAQWVSAHGHEAVKVIYANESSPPPPDTPLLAVASPQQWHRAEYWKTFHADAALVYFGLNAKLIPVVKAMKQAGIRVVLKMDSAWGFVPPFHDFANLVRLDYFRHLENPTGRAIIVEQARKSDYLQRPDRDTFRTAISSVLRMTLQSAKAALTFQRDKFEYLSLFDAITTELPYGEHNTRSHLRRLAVCPPISILAHPCLDQFRFSPTDQKEKILISVAGNWFYPTKGGKLLAQTLALALPQHPEYRAIVIGHGAEDVKQRAEHDAGHPLPIESFPFMKREDLESLYRKAQIYILPSGSESFSISTHEALSSGCSFVFSRHLTQLMSALDSPPAATAATRYSPASFASAITSEIHAWTNNKRNPMEISSAYYHASPFQASANNSSTLLRPYRLHPFPKTKRFQQFFREVLKIGPETV